MSPMDRCLRPLKSACKNKSAVGAAKDKQKRFAAVSAFFVFGSTGCSGAMSREQESAANESGRFPYQQKAAVIQRGIVSGGLIVSRAIGQHFVIGRCKRDLVMIVGGIRGFRVLLEHAQ